MPTVFVLGYANYVPGYLSYLGGYRYLGKREAEADANADAEAYYLALPMDTILPTIMLAIHTMLGKYIMATGA